MKVDTKNLIKSITDSLEELEYIKPDEIPGIDLYMDQVTTLMDKKLRGVTRYPEIDKILTKTMINNYAKNDLLPPPIKKKYSKEHVLVLIFIYYFKSILSISDIQTLLKPITEKYFHNGKEFGIKEIYEEVFGMESGEIEVLKQNVMEKFEEAERTFEGVPEEDAEFLRQFSFICLLSYDVYMKKLIIEKMIDDMRPKALEKSSKGEKDKKNTDE